MTAKMSYEKLEEKVQLLEYELGQRQRFEKINTALRTIANAVNTTLNQDELFRAIHAALSTIIDTTNFYIALYDNNHDSINFPYIVDSVDEYYPPAINISQSASLTAEVIRSGAPLLIDKAAILRQRENSTFNIPDCTPSETWLGVPLKTQNDIVGVIAVQSYYDPLCYDQTDVEVMVAVSDQVATALDRKRKEEALTESEARFRRIVATANEGIVSVSVDWRIFYANEHFAKMLGYTLDELLGKPFEDLLSEEELDDFSKQKQARTQGFSKNFERTFRTKQGADVRTLVSATAILNEDKQFVGSFGMITDISVLKDTEEKLQETIIQLRSAVKQIKTLRGIVPICMHCKNIRDDQGFWKQVEEYVREHTEAEFSHGICPDCLRTVYPDVADDILKNY